MRTIIQIKIAGLACVAMTPGALAQTPSMILSTDSAQAIIEGCKAHATAEGRSFAIAVYDAGATPVAFLRMEGNHSGIGAFAMEKAKAAATWRFSTSGMEEAVTNTPGFADAPGVVTVKGGVPVYSADGTMFLGGVGASGEPPEKDEACARAGISAAGLSFERRKG